MAVRKARPNLQKREARQALVLKAIERVTAVGRARYGDIATLLCVGDVLATAQQVAGGEVSDEQIIDLLWFFKSGRRRPNPLA